MNILDKTFESKGKIYVSYSDGGSAPKDGVLFASHNKTDLLIQTWNYVKGHLRMTNEDILEDEGLFSDFDKNMELILGDRHIFIEEIDVIGEAPTVFSSPKKTIVQPKKTIVQPKKPIKKVKVAPRIIRFEDSSSSEEDVKKRPVTKKAKVITLKIPTTALKFYEYVLNKYVSLTMKKKLAKDHKKNFIVDLSKLIKLVEALDIPLLEDEGELVEEYLEILELREVRGLNEYVLAMDHDSEDRFRKDLDDFLRYRFEKKKSKKTKVTKKPAPKKVKKTKVTVSKKGNCKEKKVTSKKGSTKASVKTTTKKKTKSQKSIVIETKSRPKVPIDVLKKDTIWSIFAKLDPDDVIAYLNTQLGLKYYKDDDMFKYLLNIHYPAEYLPYLKNIKGTESWKDKYLYLNHIISPEVYEHVKGKWETAEDISGMWVYETHDVFDLLYRETGGDHDFGAISIPIRLSYNKDGDEIHDELYDLLNEYYEMHFLTEGPLNGVLKGKRRILLNKIEKKDGKTMTKLRKYFDKDFKEESPNYPNADTITFEEYIANLLSLEDRMQKKIVESSKENILDQIQDINVVDSSDDPNFKYFYNEDEKMFLQFLHLNVLSGKIKIFDLLDDSILSKMTNSSSETKGSRRYKIKFIAVGGHQRDGIEYTSDWNKVKRLISEELNKDVYLAFYLGLNIVVYDDNKSVLDIHTNKGDYIEITIKYKGKIYKDFKSFQKVLKKSPFENKNLLPLMYKPIDKYEIDRSSTELFFNIESQKFSLAYKMDF